MTKLKQPSILVVEDEAILRGLLVTTLQAEGYLVYEAENGREGLEMAFDLHPQLILLDIIMPEMNGMDMLKQLRDDEWGSTATVTLLTNLGDNESMRAAESFDIKEYLVKSDLSLDEIAQRIKLSLES